MKKAVKGLIIVVLGTTVWGDPARGQDKNLTGAWHIQGFNTPPGVAAVIVQSNDQLTLLSHTDDRKWTVLGEGKVTNNVVTLQTKIRDKPYLLVFDGSKDLLGTGEGSANVRARFLSSLFLCSNHAPSNHVAASMGEMRRLTQELHCSGWHSVEPKGNGDAKLLELLSSMPDRAPK